MTTWFTADLHLGHARIIEYCRRPFAGAESMTAELVERWNSVVAHDDTVWVLGDFAMGHLDDTLPLTGLLAGHKILVAGNHDRCWHGHGAKAAGWTERYHEAGFDEIVHGSTTVRIGETEVGLCHFPYVGDSRAVDRYPEHRPLDRGDWLLHGHVHEKWAQRDRMINVGVDVAGFRPIREVEIARIIGDGPGERVVHER